MLSWLYRSLITTDHLQLNGGSVGIYFSSTAGFGLGQSESGKCKKGVGKNYTHTISLLFYHWLVPCPLLSLSLSLSSTHTLVYPQGRLESELAKTIDLVHIEK